MELDLAQFNPTVAELQGIVEITKSIQVTDLKDKDQLQVVRKNRIALKNARTAITRRGKELREDALKFQKEVIARERELIAIIEPEEDRLQGIEDEAAKLAEIEMRRALLPERIEKIRAIDTDLPFSEEDLLEMDGSAFQGFLNKVMADKNSAAAAAVAEREAAVKAEEDRLRREKEEAERIEQGRREERERIEREAKEAAERSFENRANRLIGLGYVWTEKGFYPGAALKDVATAEVIRAWSIEEVRQLVDAVFEQVFSEVKLKIQQVREKIAIAKQEAEDHARMKAEQEKLEKEAKYRAWLESHGLTNETKGEFYILREGSKVTLYRYVDTYYGVQ